MIMEERSLQDSPFPRISPTKRSFDVAFLTGVHDSPQSPDIAHSPVSTTSSTINTSNSPPSKVDKDNISTAAPATPPLGSPTEVDKEPTQHSSAFTKVTRHQEEPLSREKLSVSLSSASWSPSSSISAMTSILSGNKHLAPLLASSGIFNPALAPLFPPDAINNNLVEEYMKSHQHLLSGKQPSGGMEGAFGPMTPNEALSRLRSSLYSSDQYKLPMEYPPLSSQSTQSSKMNPVSFLPQPAAAAVGAMIPSALNSLNLTSQNVCAKCNLSFRMTSDLVYHMRSQHKKEQDPYRKRRNDRLRCSICGETFRERHHLTRHMTAHQDRSDEAEAK